MNEKSAADIAAALSQCASEPVHIPGRIQPNGAIVAVDNDTLVITHASANLEEVIGINPESALGQTVHDTFATGIRHDLVNLLLPQFLMQDTRVLGQIDLNGYPVYASASAANSATVFEFEPAAAQGQINDTTLHQIAFLTTQLHGVENRKDLFDKSVKLLRVLTGYHRIMVYEFDGDGNGTVRAEVLTGALEPYLGLNFPAWDIPQQARDIMARTPIRYIADVHAEQVPVWAATKETAPLDMTHSHLRGVAQVHMEYLANMKTRGSLTLNIVVGGKLWGMIALHHSDPRVPSQNIREVCRNFIRFFGLKLDGILQRESLSRLHETNQLRRELTEIASRDETENRFIERMLPRLCEAMSADGAMLIKDGSVLSHGLVPKGANVERLMDFCEDNTGVFHSSALGTEHPVLVNIVGSDISGIHITPMAKDSFIAFFRRDRERETIWAGAPTKDVEGSGPHARLRPRASFQVYKETVRGTSAPWATQEHQIASEVWSILVNSERNALIQKTTRQQKMLINELNHRVRNILTLIRSLSRQSRSTADSIDDFVLTLESRIEAVANAHSLAVERPDSYVSIHTILDLEAAPYNHDGTRIEIVGEDVGLRPDVAPTFALVVHELMTNAAKYGSLSNPQGRVRIELRPVDSGLKLHWTERGGPKVKAPTREGFGTSLLHNTVPNELKGTIDIDYLDAGISVQLTMAHDMLSGMRFVPRSKGSDDAGIDASILRGDVHQQRARVRCLLVEDSFVISMDTMRIMNEVGFETVQTAMNAPDALQAIKSEQPDFAILDVNLSGGETSHGVARHLSDLGVPFAFLTGYGKEGVPKDSFPDVPILRKPLHRSTLEPLLIRMGL